MASAQRLSEPEWVRAWVPAGLWRCDPGCRHTEERLEALYCFEHLILGKAVGGPRLRCSTGALGPLGLLAGAPFPFSATEVWQRVFLRRGYGGAPGSGLRTLDFALAQAGH